MQIVLSLDGGGIRGIIQITILDYLEKKIQEILDDKRIRLGNVVDLVAGTSTGAIIGGLMLLPCDGCNPWAKHSMQEILNLYFNFGDNVFKNNTWHNFKTLWGLIGPRFPASNIENPLLVQMDHYKLKDLIKPCLFTGYDIDKRRVNIYTNNDVNHKYADYYVKDIVRGSSAIPSYFSPGYFRDGLNINTIVDGGVFANNPAIVAFVESLKTIKNPADVLLISIGSGKSELKHHPYKKVKKWGKAQWLLPVLDVLLTSSAEVISYETEVIFRSMDKSENYKRLDAPLIYASDSALDCSKEQMANLHKDAKSFIEVNQEYLDDIAKRICEENSYMKIEDKIEPPSRVFE